MRYLLVEEMVQERKKNKCKVSKEWNAGSNHLLNRSQLTHATNTTKQRSKRNSGGSCGVQLLIFSLSFVFSSLHQAKINKEDTSRLEVEEHRNATREREAILFINLIDHINVHRGFTSSCRDERKWSSIRISILSEINQSSTITKISFAQ